MDAPSATETLKILQGAQAQIAAGHTEVALDQLTALPGQKHRNRFIRLSNRYRTLNRQFQDGTITREEHSAGTARINAALLDAIQAAETELQAGGNGRSPAIKWIAAAGVGVVLLLLGYFMFLWLNGALGCPEGGRKAIYVARFQESEEEGFSTSVWTILTDELPRERYRVARQDFQPLESSDYHEELDEQFFTGTGSERKIGKLRRRASRTRAARS